jgi:tetratricopeptide (TPR) repeat protein
MKRTTAICWFALLGVVLVGAAPAVAPDDLVRQGNAAFERGAYDAAVRLYTQAEARLTDPGLVAQNKAASLYRLGHYAEAEFYYRLCLQDATGPRRARALYGRGNALLHTARGSPKVLREAVRCYEQCLELDDLDPELADNARHNLELAKLLWLKARAAGNADAPNNPDARDPNAKQPDPPQHQGPGALEPGPGNQQPGDRVPTKFDPGQQATPIDERQPGAGNLPPQQDRGDVVPGSPEETAQQLRQASLRILQERRQYQKLSVKPPVEGVKNW